MAIHHMIIAVQLIKCFANCYTLFPYVKFHDFHIEIFYYHDYVHRFTLTLKRRPGFRARFLIIPCVVLGCLSVLVFALPPERPDRHTIATSLLSSFMFLLLILLTTAPPSAASTPKLSEYHSSLLALIPELITTVPYYHSVLN